MSKAQHPLFSAARPKVPLDQFIKQIDPKNPGVPATAAGLRNAKAAAIQATNLSPEQVNRMNQMGGGKK